MAHFTIQKYFSTVQINSFQQNFQVNYKIHLIDFKIKISMGCAGSKQKDPYSIILSKNGAEKVKTFIIGTSKVQFIEQSKQQIVGLIQKKLLTLKLGLLSQIDNELIQIDHKYQKSVNRIQQANSKAIVGAQKMFKTKFQNLMGYDQVIKKYAEYKQQCRLNLERQQNQAIAYLNTFLKQLAQQGESSMPTLKKYQGLQEDQQENFIRNAKKKNKTSLQKGMGQLQNQIEQKCNFQNFQPKMQTIVAKQKLRELSAFAQKSFMAGQEKVKGASDCRTC